MLGLPLWFVLALTGMAGFAGMALVLKQLSFSVPTPVILTYMFTLLAVLSYFYNLRAGHSLTLTPKIALLIVLATLCSFLGNVCDIEAIKYAPNAGYAVAVKGAQIVIITFAAFFLFAGQSLSAGGVAGVALVFAGTVVLALQS